jgi:hypothetical protein
MQPSIQSKSAFDRIKSALSTHKTGVKDFVLNKTYLNGKPFSLKNHEYQAKILDLTSSPDIELVIQKPSQVGISEIIYRVLLSFAARIHGFSAAITFPTKTMSNEVMATRIRQIIDECPELKSLLSPEVDSNSVKMFLNNAIIYALGASAQSKSSVINRPLRMIVNDELARSDDGVITSLRSRQRHQEHKSSISFSTPLFEEFDIDLEMRKCGVIWEQILQCQHCDHFFFPDFFLHARLPGYDDPIKYLRTQEVEKKNLDIALAYLQCPKCERETDFNHQQMEWVDTATHPKRSKIGVKISAFAMPAYVKVPDMVQDLLQYSDKNEFEQQVLGKPSTKSETTMDVTQIKFAQDEPGNINVFGLDMGRLCHLVIGTVSNETLYIHTRKQILVKNLMDELPGYLGLYNCIAGVVDFMPYSDLSVKIGSGFPNTWTAIYSDPSTPIPDLFKLTVKEDEALGNVRQVNINKNLYFDTYVNSLMEGRILFKRSDDTQDLLASHEAMRRVRNPKYVELRYMWIKPQGSKTEDHWFHSGVYCSVAARLMVKGSAGSLPLSAMLSSFRLRSEV